MITQKYRIVYKMPPELVKFVQNGNDCVIIQKIKRILKNRTCFLLKETIRV